MFISKKKHEEIIHRFMDTIDVYAADVYHLQMRNKKLEADLAKLKAPAKKKTAPKKESK